MSKNMLQNIISDSEHLVTTALGRKSKELSNQIPAISEIYSFFHEYFYENDCTTIDNLPSLPDDFSKLEAGLFKKNKKLVCITHIPQGYFKYLTLFCSGVMADSKMSPNLHGLYFCSLTLCEDNLHYEPESFTYLIQPEYFTSDNKKQIIPFLALPSTIPQSLEYQWVYLAMRKLNQDFSSEIEYKYLASEKEEIELLKSLDLLD